MTDPITTHSSMKSFKWLLTLVFGLLLANIVSAQYSMSGPTSAIQGETKTYTVNGSNIAYINWYTYNGATITGGSSNTANYKFNNSGNTLISCQVGDEFLNTYWLKKTVTVCASLSAGSISGTQTICYSGDPSTLGSSASASGGDGSFSYQWQYYSGGWTNISGATGTTYNPPSGLTSTRQYRRKVTSCSQTKYSNTIYVYVNSQLSAGTLSGPSTTCYGGDPGTITVATSPSGGDGSYAYQWQYSNDGSTGWTNISGATGATYDPPSGATSQKWYRKRVQSCGETKYTAGVWVKIFSSLSAGSISGAQTICYSGDPATLTNSSSPSGGNSSYAYQWQYSNNGSSGWTNISGATASTYNPPSGLTANRWYRRREQSCGQTVYTGNVKVTVRANLVAGSINGSQTVCYSGDPSNLGNSSSASGGDGSYSYQWQYSNNGSSGWTNISGATATTYNPPGSLTADRWYRRRVQSCSQTKYTSNVKVTVRASLVAGGINGTQTICYGTSPSTLGSSSSASGGDGSYSYQWQYSDNGSSGWANSSGATAITFNPPNNLTADRWYRRRVQSCSQTLYTGSVKVTVQPDLNAGSINGTQSVCQGGDPSTLGSASSASGGNGSYAYQWQYSNNGTSGWTDISGATATTYNPPSGLSADRWYRREVVSCSQTKNTSSIKVTVTAPPLWYADMDGDGFGDASKTMASCTQPEGYVDNNTDACPYEYGPTTGCDYTTVSPSDENYVYSRTYQDGMTSAAQIDRNSDVLETIAYYDGLGRPMQQLAIKGSPTGKDIVTHVGYDDFGRAEKEWLPYMATSGNLGTYRTTAEADTDAYYVANYASEMGTTPNPFSQKEMESTPLSRVLKQASPGEDWQLGNGHEIAFEYSTNGTDEVRQLSVTTNFVNGIYDPTLVEGSGVTYYAVGELYKNITKDENHDGSSSNLHTTEEFTDKQGKVVLKRTYALVSTVETAHDTYYVYDDYGNLTYVLPPKMEASTASLATLLAQMDDLGYQYKYDGKNRLIEKKIPGKGWEYIVYNKLDQPIMTQDANQDVAGEWLFTKYDAQGRVTYTGIDTGNNSSRATVQSGADSGTDQFENRTAGAYSYAGTSVYYSKTAYPTSFDAVYTINYYDTYVDTDGLSVPTTVLGQATTSNTQGLPTVGKVRVLGTSDWITSITGYDEKGRAIYTASKNNYLNTTDIVETELDFAGKVLQTKTTHQRTGYSDIVTTDTFAYDHTGRLVVQEETLGGQTETLFLNRYDNLGQLVTKDVGNSIGNPLQTVDYDYNVRGWLKAINNPDAIGNDLFAFGINYNTTELGATNSPLFNGNICETIWRTGNDLSGGYTRGYAYKYDALNRITYADYGVKTTGSFNLGSGYDLRMDSYDKNGNIESLFRNSQTPGVAQDDIRYTYQGNQLLKVDEITNSTFKDDGFKDGANTGNDYAYDANGNITMDLNKGIQDNGISYNHLNLPILIGTTSGNILYVYDAVGTKLEKNAAGSVTSYDGNYIYQNGTLQFFSQPEGYVTPDGQGGYDYVYQYKDHLGNVRYSYLDSNGNYEQILDSDFENSFDGWEQNGSVNYSLENGRLKANVNSAWEGVKHPLDDIVTVAGEKLTVKVYFDKGNTQSNVRLYLPEYNPGGTLVRYNTLTNDLQTGYSEFTLTMADTGNSIILLRIDKDNTNTGTETYFYIDHVSLSWGALETVEENNYYPFGLKHKGYNNVTSSYANSVAQKFKTYQGQEFTDELGLNIHEWKYRISDPAIGRFWQADPLAEDYRYQSPYNFSENRVIDGFELEGLEYVTLHHIMNGGKHITTIPIEYYKKTDTEINAKNGTPAGSYNAASFGPEGKGVKHVYHNRDASYTGPFADRNVRWDNRRVDFATSAATHGLYSGPGSITGYNGSEDYDFSFQPIDMSDAIAKRHDMDYAAATAEGEAYAGYIEDVRTYQADVDMIGRIDNYMSGNEVDGVETPFRESGSGEMGMSIAGQKVVINALATYKKWKMDNGYGNNDSFSDIGKEFYKEDRLTALIIGILANNKNN